MNPYNAFDDLWRDANGDETGFFDRDLPAWLVSVALHMALIVVLGTTWLTETERPVGLLIVSMEMEEPQQEEVPLQHFLFSEEDHPDTGSIEIAGIDIESSAAKFIDETTEAPTQIEVSLAMAPLASISALDEATAPNLSEKVMVRGSADTGTIGTEGAVDRITQEILLSLEQRPTMVVWLFDQSLSMQAQRDAVRGRFDRVYAELGVSHLLAESKRLVDKPLLTSVVAFGKEVTFRTPKPTDDLEEIKQAIAEIPIDTSGVEVTFTAVSMAVERYQAFRNQGTRRNLMVVVLTDEVGDDEQEVDRTINLCRRTNTPVYVIGVPAPFGRREIEVKFVDPDPRFDQTPQWLPVRQGPETALPEMLQLSFYGRMANPADELLRIDSGFGPYALTRLAVETGGIYFAMHPNRTRTGQFVRNYETPNMAARLNFFFDPVVMRMYQPEYVPLTEYHRRLMQNKARSALVQAAQMSQVGAMLSPRLVFAIGNGENAEAELKRQLDEAQRAAAVLEPRINALYEVLRQGEKDRPKLTEMRWRAGYDLAMGRVLAAKARTEGYNAMLALAKNGYKFKDPKNNTLVLEPANELAAGSALDRMAKQARALLEQVVDEHEGTPWALLAAEELKQPIGWKWTEKYTPPPPPRQARPPANNNNNNRPNPPVIPPNATPPKPVRPNIQL